jgi:hypothetical protein
MSAALAICAMVAIHQGVDGDWFPHVAVAVGLAFPVVLALSAAATRNAVSAPIRWGGSAAVLAAAGLYGALMFDDERNAEFLRFASLLAAGACALALTPRLWRAGDGLDRRRLWRFNVVLLVRTVTSVLYGGALMASLAGAVAAVSSLFELDLPGELYGDLAAAIFLALVPALVAGGIGDATEEPRDTQGANPAVRILGRWLYALVVVVYMAILLAYGAKVAITGDLPENLLSLIVIFAGGFGFIGAAYLDPVHGDGETRYVSLVARAFPAALLVLVPLASWALWVRFDEYGWTEPRYLRFAALLALLVLGALGTLRLVRGRPPLLAAVPLTLGAVALLAAVGPWSAQSVSRRDQRARLEAELRGAGLLRGGAPVALVDSVTDAMPEVPAERYDRIGNLVQYLVNNHGRSTLDGMVTGATDTQTGWEVSRRIPLRRGCGDGSGRDRTGMSVMGADETVGMRMPAGTLYDFSSVRLDGTESRGGVTATIDTLGALQLRDTAGWSAAVPLDPLAQRHLAPAADCGVADRPRRLTAEEGRLPVVDAAGRTRGLVVIRRLNGNAADSLRAVPRAADVSFYLVVEDAPR